jgi:cytidylate kinase
LEERGERLPIATVQSQLDERDARDQGRAHAPLKRLPDQVYLDTSAMTHEQVLARLLELVSKCRGADSSA